MISRRDILRAFLLSAAGALPASAQTRTASKAKPLSKDAVTQDWTSFLGPSHNAVSAETRLSRKLPPQLVWEFPQGHWGHTPAIRGARASCSCTAWPTRKSSSACIRKRERTCGSFAYATEFEDRDGSNNGRRASPSLMKERVCSAVGAEGKVHCLDLATGKVVWKRDLRVELPGFSRTSSAPRHRRSFKAGCSSLNVGAPGGPCVVGF